MPRQRRRSIAREPEPSELSGPLDSPSASEGAEEDVRSQQLQEPPRRFESSIQTSSSQSGVSRAVREADESVADWRTQLERSRALIADAATRDSAGARECLREAASLAARTLVLAREEQAFAELSNQRGLALAGLAHRSSGAESATLWAEAFADFQRATARLPGFEAAWRNAAELSLAQASSVEPARRRELQARALEVCWCGVAALTDPKAAGRLSVQRGRILLELASQGASAEHANRLEEARHELERATERDPTNPHGWTGWSEALRERAAFSSESAARELLQQALAVTARGAAKLADADARAELLHERAVTWIALDNHAEALAELERAKQASESCAAVWQTWAELLAAQAQHAEPERARVLYAQAFELLSQGLVRAGDRAAESRLRDRRGLLTLAAAALESGSERARRLDEAGADFKHACDQDAGNVSAWRHWAGVFSERARRSQTPEVAQELWKQADAVLDSAVHSLPLGAATAALLADRGDLFIAQAKRAGERDRRLAFERAMVCFEEATQLAPSYGPAWQSWALALAQRARFDPDTDPVACLRLALVRGRTAAETLALQRRGAVWIELALALRPIAERDLVVADPAVDELSDQLERAAADDPEHAARYWLARGNLLRDAGRFSEAEADYDRGRLARPARESLACQHNACSLLERLGREQARRDWRRTQLAYEQYCAKHDDPELSGRWGLLLFEVFGELEQAEAKLSAAVARRAESTVVFQLALVALAQERAETAPGGAAGAILGERLRAAERFVRTAALDPYERELCLGELALSAGDADRARQHLERALERDRHGARALEALGRCRLREAKLEPARRSFEQAIAAAPREHSPRLQLAAALALGGDYASAAAEYRKVLEVCPGHTGAQLGLTDARMRETAAAATHESHEAAVVSASAAISGERTRAGRRLRASELSRAYYARGYTQVRLAALEGRFLGVDRYGLARADFRRALRLDPRNDLAFHAFARLSEAMRGTSLQRLPQVAAGILCVLATLLFVIAQLSYFWSEPAGPVPLSFGGYLALSFGALSFLVAGAYLPQLLRRPVPGVDLKSGPIEIGAEWRVSFDR